LVRRLQRGYKGVQESPAQTLFGSLAKTPPPPPPPPPPPFSHSLSLSQWLET